MGAETESAVVVVRLIAVAVFIILAVTVPARLLTSSEGDNTLMQRSTQLLGETIQELLDNPEPFVVKEVMLTLPKDNDYIMLAYDSDRDTPFSCIDDDLGGKDNPCDKYGRKAVLRVDECNTNEVCLCYFKTGDLDERDRDNLNKDVEFCYHFDQKMIINGYYPFELKDDGSEEPRQDPYFRGAARVLSIDPLQQILPLEYEYFFIYAGRAQRASGANFYYVEKATVGKNIYILISPLGERLEDRTFPQDCPTGSGLCDGKQFNELLSNDLLPEDERCDQKTFCKYDLYEDKCRPACAEFCDKGYVNEPCFCNGEIKVNGVCEYSIMELPARCQEFSSCADYCSKNDFYSGILVSSDHQDRDGWCSSLGVQYCTSDPCNLGGCHIEMPGPQDVPNPLQDLIVCAPNS